MLSQESLKKIDVEVAKYPAEHKRSAVMAALRIAHQEKRWLSGEMMEFVADYLGMPAVAVLEVASFYNMYELKPVGEHKLTVCTNLSCSLSGALDVVEHLRHKLGIDFGETTPDGRFTLKEGECMGACGEAPVMLHNNHRMCCKMSLEAVDTLIEELSK